MARQGEERRSRQGSRGGATACPRTEGHSRTGRSGAGGRRLLAVWELVAAARHVRVGRLCMPAHRRSGQSSGQARRRGCNAAATEEAAAQQGDSKAPPGRVHWGGDTTLKVVGSGTILFEYVIGNSNGTELVGVACLSPQLAKFVSVCAAQPGPHRQRPRRPLCRRPPSHRQRWPAASTRGSCATCRAPPPPLPAPTHNSAHPLLSRWAGTLEEREQLPQFG